MTERNELNPNTATESQDRAAGRDESDAARRHMEHEANRMARKAGERENRDEKGNDEFKNIGPV